MTVDVAGDMRDDIPVMSEWWKDPTLVARFDAKWSKSDGCWLWHAGTFAQGYGSFRIGKKMFKAHRLSLARSLGRPLADDEYTLHSCDVRTCINPAHLRIGTYEENSHDRDTRLRANTSPLTDESVREIRKLVAQGAQQRDVARKYGIQQGSVSRVVSGVRWGWVK